MESWQWWDKKTNRDRDGLLATAIGQIQELQDSSEQEADEI